MAATPTPWKWNRAQAVYQLRGPNDEYIGHVDHSPGRLTQEANAELIVNSVNVHAENEKLIAALLDALEALVADCQDYPAWERPCYALDKARAALKLAEGSQRRPR